jgi:alanyl-tRNA synthetase
MSYEDAITTGAKAFFEDTYPEIVRVVAIGTGLSVELCGGTHVSETSQIGSFFITEQTAVAAGIKRIVALTGPKVAAHAQVLQDNLDQIANKISVPVKQLDAKIEKILAESEILHTQVEKLTIGIIKNLTRTP